MATLTKEALLALKPKIEAVPMPELGEEAVIYVSELDALSAFEAIGVYRRLIEKGGDPETDPEHFATMTTLLERSIVDQDGNQVFEPGDLAKARWLLLPMRNKLLGRILALSGLGRASTGEERKNPEPTRTSASLVA